MENDDHDLSSNFLGISRNFADLGTNNGKMNEGRLAVALSQCESTFIHFAVVGSTVSDKIVAH